VASPTAPAPLWRKNRQVVLAVRLDVQPHSEVVTLTLASEDGNDVAVTPVTMEFTRSNWNVSQDATLMLSAAGTSRLIDRVVDITLRVHSANSGDVLYRASRPLVIAVNVDNENSVPDFGRDQEVVRIDADMAEQIMAGDELVLIQVTASDADADAVSYSIVAGVDSELFAIDSATGQIYLASGITSAQLAEFLEAGNSYVITVEARDSFGGVTRLQVRVQAPSAGNENQVALSAIDSAIAFAAAEMINTRLDAPIGGGLPLPPQDDGVAGLAELSAQQQWDEWDADAAHERGEERFDRVEWQEFLYSRGFDFALSDSGVHARRMRFWGLGSRVSLSGDPVVDDVVIPYSGGVNVFMLGLETSMGSKRLGMSAGRSTAKFIVGDSKAQVRRQMTSLNPYVSFPINDRTRAWLSGSYGRGDYKRSESGSSREVVSDTNYISASGGLQTSFVYDGMDIETNLTALQAQSKMEATDQLEASKARAWRLAAGLQVGRSYSIEERKMVYKPFVGMDIRYDGGNGPFEYGQDLDAAAGIDLNWNKVVNARLAGRAQLQGGDSRERRIEGSISYDYAADGRGLMISANTNATSVADAQFAAAASTRIGYALPVRLFADSGLATFAADLSSADDGIVAENYNFRFSGRRLDVDLAAGDRQVKIKFELK
ncbi:MAG: cadherin repeat domain-containing protein, partial [Betaproteobacteria bacterium]|nr:cadherin repeat domain-containing protein [Betaproteobacteria bacterium]